MEMQGNVGAIVLAAGMSQRMGRLKPLLPFGDKPMLARILEMIETAGNIAPTCVVLGHAADEIAPIAAQCRAEQVTNPDYAAGGMLSSIQAGVRALPSDCAAFFLVLGDQPGVNPATLRALQAAWQTAGSPITLPTYEGRRGHPLLLSSSLFPEILALPPEATLKTLITRHTEQIQAIPVPDPAILFDVDTPEDYRRALEEFGSRASGPTPRYPRS
jgi:molybdenum cofactor cytidylyltransferase